MRIIIILILLGFTRPSQAQTNLESRMAQLSRIQPSANLFVHFDKNIYTNNETAYFTGYLLKSSLNINDHSVMAVVLIRNVDSAVIAQDKFIMEKGISFGSMTLPDSIQTGDYQFLVYTDRLVNGKPEATFVQHVTLKTNIEPPFKAQMKINSSKEDDQKTHRVLVSVTTNQDRFMPEPVTVNYTYGKVRRTAKTDASSQLQISLPVQQNIVDPNLYVKIKSKKDSSFISMAILQPQVKAKVKFYPEGGNLIDGLYSRVGWEVKDQQGMPLSLKALLYQNDRVIDTLETQRDGMGSFRILGKMDQSYYVKLIHSALRDSAYFIPKPLPEGLNLEMRNAVADDSAKIVLRTNRDQNITLLIHNFNQLFINQPLQIRNGYLTVKLRLEDIPKGLATITILNDAGKPLAERMFFAHYDASKKLRLETDKQRYDTREKVTLKLQLADTASKALVSIACVQQNRLEPKKWTDILDYTYLNHELQNLPVLSGQQLWYDKSILEQVLLIKGWRRYQWQDLESQSTDTIPESKSLSMTGSVLWKKKRVSEPATLVVSGGDQSRIVMTTPAGNIDFKDPDFLLTKGKKSFLIANQGNKHHYEITVNDEFEHMNHSISKMIALDAPISPSTLVDNSALLIKRNERVTTLKEVVINKKKDNFLSYARGTNACGDYVCSYRILNCRNHFGDFGNTQPIKGQTYRIFSGGSTVYTGCDDDVRPDYVAFNGIHLPKEFYHDDYKDLLEPAFFSTIYWNYGTVITKDHPEISFYTSDIVGKFKVIVQGIGDQDVIFGEHEFEVKAKTP